MKRLAAILQVLLLIAVFLTFPFVTKANDDFGDAVKALIRDHVELDRKSVGIVVGLVDDQGSRTICYGKMDNGASPEVNGDTLFDICSITKTFTVLLLQDMVECGEMKLDDPVAKYLPSSVKMPTRNSKEITLLELATHTSGLPRDLENPTPRDWRNPYADLTPAQFYASLSNLTLRRDPGTRYEYSSLGMQLLGHAIELKTGTNYETLVVDRICKPLSMDSTRVTLTPQLMARLATGHNPPNQRTPEPNFGFLLGAGGLRSSANDLLKYLSANLGLLQSSLTPAMQKTHLVQVPHVDGNMDMALGWSVSHFPGADLIGHSGRGIGNRAIIAFDTKRRRGVVVLANAYDDNRLYDIAWLLLQSEWQSRSRPRPVRINPRHYDQYVGQYQLAANSLIGIRRQGNRLLIQPAGKLTAELLPESETNFFGRITGRKVTFVRTPAGKTTGLIIHADGTGYPAARISDQPPRLPESPKTRVAINIDPKIYNQLEGRYQAAPDKIFVVRRDGNHLLAIFGSEGLEFYPESETNFFCPYADLQISFTKDNQGTVTGLILHELGETEETAKKI